MSPNVSRVAVRAPITPDHTLPAAPGSTFGEQKFTTTQAAPSAGVTTDNQTFRVAELGESGPSFLSIKGRIIGGGGSDSAEISLWAYDQHIGQWHITARMLIQEVNTQDQGNLLDITGVYAASHLAFQVHALSGGTLGMMVYEHE
jgi:hypothetical protein